MPTIVHTLATKPEDHKLLHDTFKSAFLEGECYEFAIALNQGLGWPLIGLIKPWDAGSKLHNVIWHTGVQSPDGQILDVRGFNSEIEFGTYFFPPPYVLREVTLDELQAVRPVDNWNIARARHLAEQLWPDLPWRETFAMKVRAFADELEILSRKHGLWIHGNIPTHPPLLTPGDDDEQGYEVSPLMGSHTCTIKRYYHHEVPTSKRA